VHKRYLNSEYEIYDDGRCYSYKSKKFLTAQLSAKYPTYNLTLPTGKRKVKVHRMVAETFLPRIDGKNIVNHKDGNTHNFNVNNLEWVNATENSKHASEMGLRPKSNQNAIYYTTNLNNEKWLEIKNYDNYLISNKGRVMNKNTKRLLKPATTNGYLEVNLRKSNKGKTHRIHKLVYCHFANDFDLNNYVINHIDGNKQNNDFDNLEKVTSQENNVHATYITKINKSAKIVYQYDLEGNFI